MPSGYLTGHDSCPNMGRMAGRPYAYEWANERLDGTLDALLTGWHEAELSNLAIRDQLRDRGIEVSTETVRRWRMRLAENVA